MEIVNKVAQSGIITIDLEEFYPKGERVLIDIKDHLFQGLILREKDFREFIKNENWSAYQDRYVALHCSTDAIVPTWAYMLLSSALEPYAKKIVFGNLTTLETVLFDEAIAKIDLSIYYDARIVIKGCGKTPISTHAFVEITKRLKPHVKSIMYGEPCSTVPVYKQSKANV